MESLAGRRRTTGTQAAITIAVSVGVLVVWTGFMRAVTVLALYLSTMHNEVGLSADARRAIVIGGALAWAVGSVGLAAAVHRTVRSGADRQWIPRLQVVGRRIAGEIAPIERDAPMSRTAALLIVVAVVFVVVVGVVATR